MLLQPIQAYIEPIVYTAIISAVTGAVISCGYVFKVRRQRIRVYFAERKIRRMEKKLAKKSS